MRTIPPADATAGLLTGYGLTAEQLCALRRQGFVSRECRGAGRKEIYKLRFRWQGRQQVRYLGTDPAVAAQVRAALLQWQASARRQRDAQRAARQARQALREAKRRLEPRLAEAGFAFHGLAIRRTRPGLPETEAPDD